MPRLTCLLPLTLGFLAHFGFASSVHAASAQPRLLLAGGHLPVCSSASPDACQPGRVPGPAALATRYRLDAAGIARIRASGWLAHRSAARDQIAAALDGWHARVGDLDFAADELPDALARGANRSDRRAWGELASFERDRVLDALEREPTHEQVLLEASTAQSGAAIYREFVAMARTVSKRERPHILISTASGRDPFESVAFYRAVFEQAGAQVRWLPLDHALRAAQGSEHEACTDLDLLRGTRMGAHDRARLYPELSAELHAACKEPAQLDAALAWADGVFLNGGDQSFTRAAWFEPAGVRPSAQLVRMLARLEAGTLVLGGTSAGTAVQAARSGSGKSAMIVSGPALPSTSAQALKQLPPFEDCAHAQACAGIDADALLFHPGGGLGSFAFGVLDTHFSNRGREYRLARLLLDAGLDLGVGIDETTALRVDRVGDGWRGSVLGAGGVTLLQRIGASQIVRSRYVAGETLQLPPQPAASRACVSEPGDAVHLQSDSDALQQWLDALPEATAQSALLLEGKRRVDAGYACALPDSRAKLWVLKPAQGPD